MLLGSVLASAAGAPLGPLLITGGKLRENRSREYGNESHLTEDNVRRGENARTGWRAASPESQSVSGKALDDLKSRLAARNTKALLVVRNDRLIFEF